MATATIAAITAVGCVPTPDPTPTTTTTTTSTTTSTTTTMAPTPCTLGTFSETGTAPCTPAPAGSYVDTVGATNADLCPLGTFQDLAGATSCKLAPIGSYVDTVGATSATNCPAGTTTTSLGAIAASDCVQVPAFTWTATTPVSASAPPYTDPLVAAASGTILGIATLNCTGTVQQLSGGISFYRGTGNPLTGGSYPDLIGHTIFPSTITCGAAYPIEWSGNHTYSAGDQIAAFISLLSDPSAVSVTFLIEGPFGGQPTQVLNTLTP